MTHIELGSTDIFITENRSLKNDYPFKMTIVQGQQAISLDLTDFNLVHLVQKLSAIMDQELAEGLKNYKDYTGFWERDLDNFDPLMEVPPPPVKIYVIASSQLDYKEWCRRNNRAPGDRRFTRHTSDVNYIRGLSEEWEIISLSFNPPDTHILVHYARQGRIVDGHRITRIGLTK